MIEPLKFDYTVMLKCFSGISKKCERKQNLVFFAFFFLFAMMCMRKKTACLLMGSEESVQQSLKQITECYNCYNCGGHETFSPVTLLLKCRLPSKHSL